MLHIIENKISISKKILKLFLMVNKYIFVSIVTENVRLLYLI